MGPGGHRASGVHVFGGLKADSLQPVTRIWVDSGHVENSGVTQQDGLRRDLEAVGREPCFDKDMTLDIVGHGLRVSFRLLRLAVVIEVIRP